MAHASPLCPRLSIGGLYGRIFDDEGKPAWSTPEVVEVVEFARELVSNEYIPAVNVTGDLTITSIVAKSEGSLDEEVFYDPHAGDVEEIHLPHRSKDAAPGA